MTVVAGLRPALKAMLAAYMPEGVQVEMQSPGEDAKVRGGAIWVRDVKGRAQWRSLGMGAGQAHRDRQETVTVVLVAVCYRTGPSIDAAADAATDRIAQIVAGVEAAIEADHTIGGRFSSMLLQGVDDLTWPQEKGITAASEITLAAETQP